MAQEISILMLGGKRCGKTTVLASMYGQINKALAGTPLSISRSEETGRELEAARAAIQEKLNDFDVPLTRVEVDDNPTSAMKKYSFQLSLGSSNTIPFAIYDIPGEWLTDNHQDQVKALISQSSVIIIAIDTPYLFAKMTDKGYGIYHEEYNKPLEIANFFKNSLSVDEIRDRMILFVPIKCERYYHLTHTPQLNVSGRDYMQELVDAIGCGYRDLLMYLKSTPALINGCTMAITPILSAGGIDFVHFRTDSQTGRVVSLYQKPEFLREYEQGYTPKFCEQPMVYILTYILMKELADKKSQADSKMFKASTVPQLEGVVETLRKKIKRNVGYFAEDGFYIIQNPREI
ncbi:MAG: hypothetical protein LUH19_06905 [Lachnospiraceae bacterium]|nr:hypothetical protein [Lachnospiraceae bacterium]